jgi:hypothetical protein
VIRSLTPDEVVWFVGRALRFLGHSDPNGISQRLGPRLRDAAADAAHSFVYLGGSGTPSAGAYLRAPDPEDDDQSLRLASLWHDDDPEGLCELVAELLRRHPHEAAFAALHGVNEGRVEDLAEALAPLGFARDQMRRLRFDLAEVPPLGLPLVLEAWTLSADPAFRELFERAEARAVSDRYWAFLKRREGPFRPDLWFLARETLDQEPVGYVLFGTARPGVDAAYLLVGSGVLQEHRVSSEMLRRLVVTALNELAGSSPFGTVEGRLSTSDPKLIAILMSLGFVTLERYPMLVRLPG